MHFHQHYYCHYTGYRLQSLEQSTSLCQWSP